MVVVVVAQVVFYFISWNSWKHLQRIFATLKGWFLGLGQLPIAPALEQRLSALASSLGTTPRALQPAKKSVFHLGSEPNKHSGIII